MRNFDHVGDIVALRDFSMPNYWAWYHADDIPKVLRSLGRVDLYPLLILTIYQACAASWLVGAAMVWVAMFLVIRTVSFHSWWNWIWVLGAVAMTADLVEDLMLIIILINFPVTVYPTLNAWTAWSSFIKFLFWGLLFVFDGVFGCLWLTGRSVLGVAVRI
ncbi:transmembrane protein, putative [Bodo saltans]|uniref:Transmembrane protein, putative n=1 Tax=Bodo saltans TaxID=75058 RepID=A0A0S4JDY9_BODSA|nr:transmembrane protein, putative [Bodo saltans]|eukprot:CUG88251.1 transmembrane protein, putative [Bodo saltans]